MTTIVTDIAVRKTQKDDRQELFNFRGSYADTPGEAVGRVSLSVGQSKTLVSTKLLCVYFPKPTVIQLTINTITTTMTVNGTLVLPVAASMTVLNSSSSTTDPLTFNYVVA